MYLRNIHKKGSYMKMNSSSQIFFDGVIKVFLDKYDKYQLGEEFKDLIKQNNEIFSEEPLLPDLVIKNKVFNKNNCFYEANLNENNYFPRDKFKINENKLNNNQSSINNNNKNYCPKSNDLIDFALNSDLNAIKEMVKGGNNNNNILHKEKENLIFELIKSNSIWIINIDGFIANFNSWELFEYMTLNILCKNKKLDDYIIYNNITFRNFEGGYLYICLKKYLPLFFSQQNNNNNDYNNNNNFNYKSEQINNNNINYTNNINFSAQNFMNTENENLNFGFNYP